jgi:hypothetical protein
VLTRYKACWPWLAAQDDSSVALILIASETESVDNAIKHRRNHAR